MPIPHRRPATAAVLSAWFVALAVPTIAFKLRYVWIATAGDLSLLQPSMDPADTGRLVLLHLLPADVIDVALAVSALFLVGGALSWRIGRLLANLLVAAALVAGTVSLLSLRETGALASRESWEAGWHWLTREPHLVFQAATPRAALVLGLGAVWLAAPPVLSHLFDRAWHARARSLRFVVPLLLVVFVGAAMAVAPRAVLGAGNEARLTQSFWRSVILTFAESESTAPAHLWSARGTDAEYARQIWPAGRAATPSWLTILPAEELRPRHVVIITLETAPHALYDLERTELPHFRAMSQQALIADRHQTSAPMTSLALYSVFTGLYPPASSHAAVGVLRREPGISEASLVGRLRSRGYQTSFVDSYDLTWNGPDEEHVLKALGFQAIADARTARYPQSRDAYADRVARDSASFGQALTHVLDASAQGRFAFVTVATHLGHYDWPTPSETTVSAAAGDRLLHVARALDRLTGDFVRALQDHGLARDTITVVTGDHGLRFKLEFDALGLPVASDLTFHVPLLIHAPGLFASQVRVPYVTSHIDLTPTLLDLTGTPREQVYHGDNLLDRRVADRVTFLPSGAYPGLGPVDALHWRGVFSSYYEVVDRVTFRRDGDAAETSLETGAGDGLSASDVRRLLRTRTSGP